MTTPKRREAGFTFVEVVRLLDSDITAQLREGRSWPISGTIVCLECGGDLKYKAENRRAMRGQCGDCGYKVLS